MRIARGLGLAVVVLVATGAAAVAGEVIDREHADGVELLFDDADVLHMVVDRSGGEPNALVHRTRTGDGPWSAPEPLGTELAIASGPMKLVRRHDGVVCLFFNGWRDPTDISTVGLYLRCLEDGTWSPAEQVGVGVGVTAVFDGAFDASGTAHQMWAVRGRIGYGDVEISSTGVDAGWPSLAIDADRTLHAVWAAFGNPFGIFTSRSTDAGATWTTPESLTGVAIADVPYDLIADGSGSIHLMIPGSYSVYRKWSEGAWSAIVALPTELGPKRLAVAPDGLAALAWAAQGAVFVMRQRPDTGWTEAQLVDRTAMPPSRLALAVDSRGDVVVAWNDEAGVSVSGVAAGGFADSVPSPFDITLDPIILVQSAALAAGVVLLVPLPAQLFNNTIEANFGRISGAVAGFRRRLTNRATGRAAFWRGARGAVVFFLIAAVISAFLDPAIALDIETALTVAGLFAGLVVVAVAFTLPSVLLHRVRSRGGARLEVRPLALPIAIASVAVSRLTSFQPGYLYGLLAGVELQGASRPGDQARGVALSSWWVLALAIAAWFGLVPVRELLAAADPPPWALAGEAALATIVVSGLEGLLFGLLPLAITPGGVLFRERRRTWAVLMAVAGFAFFHVLVNPTSGYLVDSATVPLLTTLALFAAFSALTVATWLYFRLRPGRVTRRSP